VSLRPYASAPGRRTAQLLADAGVVVAAVVCVVVGRAVRDAVDSLAAPGLRLQAGAGGLADSLRRAARSAGDLPFVGDDLRRPLSGAGGSADELAAAGSGLATSVHHLAAVLGLVVGLLPFLVVLALWLPPRLRFAVRAGAAAGVAATPAGTDLLALRALATQPLGVLTRLDDDPAAAWRRGDPALVRALADLERRSLGLPAARGSAVDRAG
jgi:hypothetical protein